MATKTYICNARLRDGNGLHEPGEEIRLPDEEAEALLAAGRISDPEKSSSPESGADGAGATPPNHARGRTKGKA